MDYDSLNSEWKISSILLLIQLSKKKKKTRKYQKSISLIIILKLRYSYYGVRVKRRVVGKRRPLLVFHFYLGELTFYPVQVMMAAVRLVLTIRPDNIVFGNIVFALRALCYIYHNIMIIFYLLLLLFSFYDKQSVFIRSLETSQRRPMFCCVE